jgi:hypothetical protein
VIFDEALQPSLSAILRHAPLSECPLCVKSQSGSEGSVVATS